MGASGFSEADIRVMVTTWKNWGHRTIRDLVVSEMFKELNKRIDKLEHPDPVWIDAAFICVTGAFGLLGSLLSTESAELFVSVAKPALFDSYAAAKQAQLRAKSQGYEYFQKLLIDHVDRCLIKAKDVICLRGVKAYRDAKREDEKDSIYTRNKLGSFTLDIIFLSKYLNYNQTAKTILLKDAIKGDMQRLMWSYWSRYREYFRKLSEYMGLKKKYAGKTRIAVFDGHTPADWARLTKEYRYFDNLDFYVHKNKPTPYEIMKEWRTVRWRVIR